MVTVACVVAVLGWAGHRHRQDVVGAAEAQLSALSRAALAGLEGTFTSVELLLRTIDQELSSAGSAFEADGFSATLAAKAKLNPEILSIAVIEGDRVAYASRTDLIGVSVAGRVYMRHFQANPGTSALFISEPTRSLVGRDVIFAALPRHDAGRRLVGLVVATLSPEMVSRVAAPSLPTYADSSVSVFNQELWRLARIPDPEGNYRGMKMGEESLTGRFLASGRKQAIAVGTASTGGAERLMAFLASERYPLAVATTAPMIEVLQPWSRLAAAVAAVVVVLSLAAWGVAGLMERHLAERERAAQAIRSERDFITSAIESLPGVFYVISQSGRFVRWNRSFETVVQRSAEEMAQLSPLDLFEGYDRELIAERIAEVFTTGSTSAEAAMLTGGGLAVPYYFTGHLCRLDGEPHLVGLGIELTELKKLQAELEQTNADLKRFAYVTSHQLQEPLRSIASYVQLLRRRYAGRLDADADTFIDYAVDGAQRMSILIHDLLAFADSRSHPVQSQRVDLNALVMAMTRDLAVPIAAANAGFEVGTLPEVLGNPGLLSSVFSNLVANSLKYRAADRVPLIAISARPAEGGFAEIVVADNGIGIAPEYRQRVFEPFQRLHAGKQYEGTGIGLSLVRRVVEVHGGRVWIGDGSPLGTEVHFTLPMAAA